MRSLTDEQYKDVIKVLAMMPVLSLEVTTEVIDDEEQHVVTAGSIITVTIMMTRKSMESLMSGTSILKDGENSDAEQEDKELDGSDIEDLVELNPEDSGENEQVSNKGEAANEANNVNNKKKTPVWKKPQKKKAAKKPGAQKQKNKSKPKQQQQQHQSNNQAESAGDASNAQEDASGSDDESGSESGDNNEDGEDRPQSNPENDEDEEAEWERFQRKMNKREKALEGKSRISHSVHCPYFTDDKQEFWWVYIADRKNHALITPPYHVTSLVQQEEVELKFTAPPKPGHYTFTVCVRSDSYLGLDHQEDIKLDVQEAREAVTEHPQWEFEDDDEDENSKDDDSDDEFATDDDFDEEDDE
jgi:translocation protein SEC63